MRLRKLISIPLVLRKTVLRALFQRTNRSITVYSAFPKSASNHLVDLISIGTGNRMRVITPKLGIGFGHNFIDRKKIYRQIGNYFKDILIYGHIPFNNFNGSVIREFGPRARVIVSIRPLPDIVVSYKEHVDKGFGPLDYRIPGFPECNPSWTGLDDKRKYDYVIKFILPWYIRYTIGWLAGGRDWPLRFVTFEEHTLFPYEFLLSMGHFLEIDIHSTGLKEATLSENKPPSNYNVGKQGRGYQLLSQEQLDEIRNLFSCFDDSFLDSNVVKYLLCGYEGLAFDVEDVIGDYAQQGAPPDRFSAALQSRRRV